MEKPVQRMHGIERVTMFGVRHLSPAASYQLIQLLNKKKPRHILIEGPSDATELMKYIAHKQAKPPIAILAYTESLPVDVVVYPFADYSPEFQAILWGLKNGAETRFIDLPSPIFFGLNELNKKAAVEEESKNEDPMSETTPSNPAKEEEECDPGNIYKELARLNNCSDYEEYWERTFEHNLNEGSYLATVKLHSSQMREISGVYQRDLLRESYMLMEIEKTIKNGAKPEEIVVVTGAFHSDAISNEITALTEAELKKIPTRSSKLTLMPYSFYKLSSYSGYGAGNNAPAYYQLMWELMNENKLQELPTEYVTRLGRHIREQGGYCSTASVIETVRLSTALAFLKNGSMPTLSDLHSSAIACMGHGEESEVINAFAAADVGVTFGYLPEGLSQTPIQDDFAREIKRLRLEKYKSTVMQVLELDLRNALDLERSVFLNRLRFLGIDFCKQQNTGQDSATWKEKWELQWTPEVEIQTVEAVLKGETLELATAFVLKEDLQECKNVIDTAKLISKALLCNLIIGLNDALATLQSLTTDSDHFANTADAARELSNLIQYGDIRKFDVSPLVPILSQLFLRASLILNGCSSCNDAAAAEMVTAISTLNTVSQESYEFVDDSAWLKALQQLAMRDDKNAKLSGLSFAILLERNIVSDDVCTTEVSRRLSAGIPADIGAAWFEGLSMRNHYALLSRVQLWKELDQYIVALDDEDFKRSVVFMRRAFSAFEPKERNAVAELLGDIWDLDEADVSIAVQAPLSEDELSALESLDDFDFEL